MSKENPYDSPKQTDENTAAIPVQLIWSVVIVIGSTIVCGIAGLGIGWALGTFVPGYYRSIFLRGQDPDFDPVAIGIGQGLTQGIVLGAVIGLILVAMNYWFRSRLAARSTVA